MIYRPHIWVIVEIKSPTTEPVQKVLGSWYGGFAYGDSWKLSSGNKSISTTEEGFVIPQESGSIYICNSHESTYTTSTYTNGIYTDFEKQLKEVGGTIRILDFKEVCEKI